MSARLHKILVLLLEDQIQNTLIQAHQKLDQMWIPPRLFQTVCMKLHGSPNSRHLVKQRVSGPCPLGQPCHTGPSPPTMRMPGTSQRNRNSLKPRFSRLRNNVRPKSSCEGPWTEQGPPRSVSGAWTDAQMGQFARNFLLVPQFHLLVSGRDTVSLL